MRLGFKRAEARRKPAKTNALPTVRASGVSRNGQQSKQTYVHGYMKTERQPKRA